MRAAAVAQEAIDRCLVCGGDSFVPMFGNGTVALAERKDGAAPGAYRITHSPRELVRAIVRCRECGLGTLPSCWRDRAAVAYAQGEDPSYVRTAPERIANAHHLLHLVPSGGRLLDVGCACGFLLVAARERGFDVRGVEPSAWATAYARREFGLDVWHGSLEEAPLEPASFDVVVLADAIEHLSDPRAALKKLYRLLKPGGRLLLLTPDAGSLMARLAGVHWWGLLDDHYHYFDRRTLRRLLEDEGFTVERVTALGREFPLQHWVYKLSQYSPRLHRAVEVLLRATRLDRLRITINLGDQMACLAQKAVRS
jgi:2-polyprenyl-3-methyl-5-hydroxy-6-metoxy-1,4-benzoquinol methylase